MFFIEDGVSKSVPIIDDENVDVVPRFWMNPTTLIVGTEHRDEGDTRLCVTDLESDAPTHMPRFECSLQTPSRVLEFCTSEGELLFKFDVRADVTRIRIWSNDDKYPDDVLVLLS